MTILSHLRNVSNNAVLNGLEKVSINKSIDTLERRLSLNFNNFEISKKFKFGSSTRGTILPRRMDSKSDIDYMIVFRDSSSRPATYLNRLKRFVNTYYFSSEIYQSSPTIVLNLRHIRFDLVPAIDDLWGAYKIPAPASGYLDWTETDPNDFNRSLIDKNISNNSLIKPLIRLIKYWNSINNYVFESYGLEKKIIEMSFWFCNDLKDYFYQAINNLDVGYFDAEWKKSKLNRAKVIVKKAKDLEEESMPFTAEIEIKKLIPEIL